MFLCIVFAIAPVTFAQDLLWRPSLFLTEEEHRMIFEEAERCGAYTHVHPVVVKRFLNFKIYHAEETKGFLYCVFMALNYATVDGHLNEKFISLYKGKRFEKEVKYVFDKCKSQNKYNFLETLYQEVDCFFERTPVTIGQDTDVKIY